MQITFNTNRKYTAEGQIITARYDAEDKKIYFCDHSRMIYDKQIECTLLPPRDAEDLARKTMQAYDNSRHTWAPFDKRPVRDETKAPLNYFL